MQAISKEKISEWQLLFDEREKNKLSIKGFCQQKNISPSSYYYYQDLIKNPDKTYGKKVSKQLQKGQTKKIQSVKIITNTDKKDNASIHLMLPNSLQCILSRDISLNEMKAIVELLLSC